VADGAFVLHEDVPHAVLGPRLLRWTPGGYASSSRRPRMTEATLITPPSLAALLDEWESALPLLHPSSARAG
jgi:hypothetical protein